MNDTLALLALVCLGVERVSLPGRADSSTAQIGGLLLLGNAPPSG